MSFFLSAPVETNIAQFAIDMINRLQPKNARVWYVAPLSVWTPFRVFALRSNLGFDKCAVAVDSVDISGDLSLTLWSVETLHANRWQIGTTACPLPDVIIYPFFEMLGDARSGHLFESILLTLADRVPALFLSCPLTHQAEATGWLRSIGHRDLEIKTILVEQEDYPLTFLTADWEVTPLLDKKRIATRVKNSAHEHHQVRQPSRGNFVQRLLSGLRKHTLWPSVVILPTPADCEAASQVGSIRTTDESTLGAG